MRKIAGILFLTLTLTACNGVVGDFVGGAKPAEPIDSQEPPTPTPGVGISAPASVRISPGFVRSTSGPVSMEARISPTKRVLTSGPISAEVTIGRTRTQ